MTRNIENNMPSMHNASVLVFVYKCLYLKEKRCYINYNNEDCTFCMPFVLFEFVDVYELVVLQLVFFHVLASGMCVCVCQFF